jgi:hypothetical protein
MNFYLEPSNTYAKLVYGIFKKIRKFHTVIQLPSAWDASRFEDKSFFIRWEVVLRPGNLTHG